MKISVIPGAQLSADHLAAWSRLQQSEAALASPFFRPEFTQAVAAVRGDVEVAVWEQNDEPVGFLPFERYRRRVGRPVGSHMNEFQGAIARQDVAWNPQEILRAAGLQAWKFDHLAATQTAFSSFQYVSAASPYLDLSGGFEQFRASRSKSSSEHISKAMQKSRKAERELGAVRLEVDPNNRQALRQLLEWKTEQCRRTNFPCNYSDWVVEFLERLLDHTSPEFSGMLLSLYIGDRLAAVQYGLRSGGNLHGTIVGYDPALGKYSPGMALLIRIAQQAGELGLRRFDLGKGGATYKDGLASGVEYVTEGAVHARPVDAAVYRTWLRAKDRLRATRLRGPVRRVRRWIVSTSLWLGYAQ